MIRILLSVVFLTIIKPLSAQHTLSGGVQDSNNAAVPFANVAVMTVGDSSITAGSVTDDRGRFSIPINPGTYHVRITFLSFEEKWISSVKVPENDNDIDLGNIILKQDTRLLETIEVEGERSQLELRLDKRIFNVGKDLSNISGSASEILDNVPSVSVDIDGNVSLRGSQNVRILIDGKPSGLTGISTADALRQLQGNLIESIEVITNPSARYDAEGEVGIINIVLKKERQKGLNGSFSANAGYPENHGASFTMNFRRQKMNFFSSYGINYRSSPGAGNSFQQFSTADTTFAYLQNSKRTRGGLSHNVRAGIDYFLDEYSTLTGALIVRASDGLNTSNFEYLDLDESNFITQRVTREEREEEPEFNSEIALSYRKEFPQKDRLLTADFKWIENIETERARFTEINHTLDSITFQRSGNSEDERNILAQIDYIHPFSKNGKWEAGLRTTMRVLNNDFLVEQQNTEEGWDILDNFNNNLIYTENIHAFYFMAANEFNKLAVQAGIRGELSDISVELTETEEVNNQLYFNLFPSAHISYKLTPDKTVQLSYSYRLSRPRFRDLLPFSNFSDRRAQWGGNPNLRPEYTHSLEAGYLVNWETGSLLPSAYYRYRTGVIERITTPVDDPDASGQILTRTLPVNLSTEDAYGFEFNLSWNPVKWWRWNSNANFYRAITEGQFEGQRLFSDTYTLSGRATSMVRFFQAYDFQTGFRYMAPRQTPQGRMKSIFTVDLGLSRDVLKKNGTLTLSVRDLFNSRKRRSIVESEGYYAESEFQWRARQIMLTFTYRLNREKDRNNGRSGDGPGDDDMGGDF